MRPVGLGYLGINSVDPEEWLKYGREVLGLNVVEQLGGDANTYLQMDERAWRLAIYEAEFNGPSYVGWELASEVEFQRAVAELELLDMEVHVADSAGAQARSVQALAQFIAPGGHRTELFHGQAFRRNFVSPAGHRFVTGNIGMGHVVLTVPPDQYREVLAFYQNVMGFRVSEYLSFGWLEGVLMHCGPRHHSLGLAATGKRPGFEHFMMEVTELDDVGRCLDRALDAGVPITRTLGRHSDDLMVSFYMKTPSRFDIEFGVGGAIIDPETWSAVTLSSATDGDYWGHRRPGPPSSEPSSTHDQERQPPP